MLTIFSLTVYLPSVATTMFLDLFTTLLHVNLKQILNYENYNFEGFWVKKIKIDNEHL